MKLTKTTLLIQIIVTISNFPFSFQTPHCYVSKVSTRSNETLCGSNYFIFPENWDESEDTRVGGSRGHSETNDVDFTLCCPVMPPAKIKDGDQNFWWPNEIHRGISRAILNCNPASIPGIETIRFLYYTNNNDDPDDFTELITGSRKTLRVSRFVKDAPLKIIIHGFMSSPFVGPARALRNAYSQLPYAINIIAVQWEALANLVTASDSICYNIAAQSTKLVGKRTAELIEFLVSEKMATISNVHVLGHSLGAHCAGFTGKHLTIGKLGRITGFDPARPNFDKVPDSERIHHTDAQFVDIIHTATKDWRLLGMVTLGFIPFPVGLREPVGHADFYPNYGSHQPGCSVAKPTIPVLCSHARSYIYYAESITYFDGFNEFIGRECLTHTEVEAGSCSGNFSVAMGEYTPRNNQTRRMYFLLTNKNSPYAILDLNS